MKIGETYYCKEGSMWELIIIAPFGITLARVDDDHFIWIGTQEELFQAFDKRRIQ
jgi:hypothetical protein